MALDLDEHVVGGAQTAPRIGSVEPLHKSGMAKQVLVIEDDRVVRNFIEEFLTGEGYRVIATGAGDSMSRILTEHEIDLAILDIGLPGENGLELTKRIRAGSDLPIIMVTARDDIVDKVVGLEIGADDYISKPFEPRELLARVRSVLRRAHRSSIQPAKAEERPRTVARFAGWRLDLQRRQLMSPGNDSVQLTSAEFDLLSALISRPNRVLSREQLIDLSYGRTMYPFERSIDTLVARLRRKIEIDRRNPVLIKTVRGAGYVFSADVEWS